ncbi:MAG TPA: glycosyltransferase [Gemmatimonadaceae bacterium]|jgi:glycosyltransferase involved in cell wall biosynthesis
MSASVVIRTKNEEAWIGRCLAAIRRQDVPDLDVVIVDNESTDRTVEIATQFDCRLVTIPQSQFNYSLALNLGIEAAANEYVAIISGHCLPVNDKWARRLLLSIRPVRVAGAYGRQEPLPDTGPFDKRDLWTTFGVERRVQSKDFFFHNANSIIRKSVWRDVPFNENINGVEDRDWAKKVLERGHTIVYEPAASVYHHHGIHQGRDEVRAARVARVIELIHGR